MEKQKEQHDIGEMFEMIHYPHLYVQYCCAIYTI